VETLKVTDLSFSYPLCQMPAVNNLSFTVNKGEFVTVCGATGSGKSTLLRLLKPELAPLGEKNGNIVYNGVELSALDAKTSAGVIGFVMQRPEQQLVTDKVWHELAFGMENLGIPQAVMARRIAEISAYFGIEKLYGKKVSELSGGQKQMLALASVMVMDPELLILDEPTSQLDPIAAADFIATVKKINLEFGITVIITEHRLEEVIPVSDRLLILEKGELISEGAPREVIAKIKERPEILCAMPAAARLFCALNGKGECPLTVAEGRAFVKRLEKDVNTVPVGNVRKNEDTALEYKGVYFRYSKELPDVLSHLDLKIYKNEIFCILGGNGSGKTTALSVAAGIFKPYYGEVRVFGKKLKEYKNASLYKECLALMPQDVQTVFLKNTVKEELAEVGADMSALPFDISRLYSKHPYDLSGGEQQLVALAKILATKPKLLLLDEPTKGIDANAKNKLTGIIKRLQNENVTVVIVTHDVEFAAECADRCALFFGGNIVSVGEVSEFFCGNKFYTTAVNRMLRGCCNAVTVGQAAAALSVGKVGLDV